VNKLQVPTWSYTAVHNNCVASVINDPSLELHLMKELVAFYEHKNQTNWDYNLPEEFHHRLLKAIVWVKLDVTKIEGKFKLSQNREKVDYENVVLSLAKKGDAEDLLRYMALTNPHSH
jgi:transcriptional regulator